MTFDHIDTPTMYLQRIERSSYWIVWIGITVYAMYKFAKICRSDIHMYRLNSQDFKDGFLSSEAYDATDFEWQSFKKLYINYWYIVMVHFALSNIFTVYEQPVLKLTSWILITLYATYTIFSFSAFILITINVIMLILLAILGKNFLSYALCFGVVLAAKSTDIANRIFNPNDPRMTNEFDYEEKRFLFTYCLCFLNARGLSAALENLKASQKKEIQSGKDQFYEKVITIAAYLLYLPGFIAGPIYMYNDFERATRLVNADPTKKVFLGKNYFKSMTALFILLANVLYYEWLLHWIYSSAVSADHVLVASYDGWQLSGFLVSLCMLFYLKYTCIFGTFKVLATFDGVGSVAPPLPKCIAAIHLPSQLWRTFDSGIYMWLKNYFYGPIARSGSSHCRRFMATIACFLCVAVWHLPLTTTLIMWISLNVLCTFAEIWARSLSRTQYWLQSVKYRLSRPAYLRLLAFVSLPVFGLTLLSSLFFLSSNDQVGNEFVKRILSNSNNYALYLGLVLYCGASVSLDYNQTVD